jgi:hypothetical protein
MTKPTGKREENLNANKKNLTEEVKNTIMVPEN